MDLNSFSIIPAGLEQKQELTKAFQNYSAELDSASPLRGIHAKKFIEIVLKNEKRKIFWLIQNGKKAGFAVVSMERSWPDTENFKAKINEFYIFPEHRKKGAGQSFFTLLKSHFNENICINIEIEVLYKNEKALSFWKKMGFETKKIIMRTEI